jgi:hypothetical protein
MDGAGRPREIPLKAKYRLSKPKGKNRASYMGNSGISKQHKHVKMPVIHGIKRKGHRRKI